MRLRKLLFLAIPVYLFCLPDSDSWAGPDQKEKRIGFRSREREARYNAPGQKRARIAAGDLATGFVQDS